MPRFHVPIATLVLSACALHPAGSARSYQPEYEAEAEPLEELKEIKEDLAEAAGAIETVLGDGDKLAAEVPGLDRRLRIKPKQLQEAVRGAVNQGQFEVHIPKMAPEAREQLQSILVRLRDAVGSLRSVPEDVDRLEARLAQVLPRAKALHGEAIHAARERREDFFASLEARAAADAQLHKADAALKDVETTLEALRAKVEPWPDRARALIATLARALGM